MHVAFLHTHEAAWRGDNFTRNPRGNANVDSVTNQPRKKSPWKKLPSAFMRLQVHHSHAIAALCCVVATAGLWID
jgi:hypothetical protein